MHRGWKAAVAAAVLGVGGAAGAHELTCEKQVKVLPEGGGPEAKVVRFPATLGFTYEVTNVHPTAVSVATSAEDSLLAPRGFRFEPGTPLGLGVGESRSTDFELRLESPEDCQALAASDGRHDLHFDSTFRVTWELGEAQCGARVTCCEPFVDCETACPEGACEPGAATRGLGFFKVHAHALQQCLDQGRIDLGSVADVASLESALGVLWGSPGLYSNGKPRGEWEAQRFLLARETLVATCNERLLGASPGPGGLLDEARRALRATEGASLEHLIERVKRSNEQGAHAPLPPRFDPGPAAPAQAARLAVDPTAPRRP